MKDRRKTSGGAPIGVEVCSSPALVSRAIIDALGRPVIETAPDGSLITRAYNEAGQLRAVSARGAMLVSSITYDEKGRRSSLTHQGDVTRTYE